MPVSFVLALFGFSSNLRALREERARRASLETGEYQLSRYTVHRADRGRSRWSRSGQVLQTTDRAVEMWDRGDRRWRHPWQRLTFAGGRDGRGGSVTVTPADGSPQALRRTAGATVYEVLAATRLKGAYVTQ
ncbi:hypothetical protein [Streptomyces sp. NPDC049813]|uniref:hypothetical protein n=1 Tax=Streptomyces sp. NPDC049813 TaxID=3365597 RepID=UPI0037B4836E